MATLQDNGNRGLPKPPAPPRRSANPWRLSQSARMQEPAQSLPPAQPSQPSLGPQLLAELMKGVPAQDAAPRTAAPARPATRRSGPGLIGLVIVVIAVTIAIRVFSDARDDGDWMRFIGPLIFIVIAVHGWWRSRRRHDSAMDGSESSGEQ